MLLVTTAVLNTKATDIENKMLHITCLATFVDLNTKFTEIRKKIPNATIFILLLQLLSSQKRI